MTTLLPQHDLAMLRAIARTASVLLVCLRIDQLNPGRAIADHEIADILEADKRTVQKQLRSLSAAGLVIEQGFRWVVTSAGRNTLFGQASQPALIEDAQNVHDCDGKDNHAQNARLMNDDDIKSINDSDSSSPIIERTNCAQILEATGLLFGAAVGTKGITDRDPDVALAWIGKAWADRKTLRSPQGLIYRRLRDNDQPPAAWLDDPCHGLPEEYLRAIGRWVEQEEIQEELVPLVPGRSEIWLAVLDGLGERAARRFSSREPAELQGNVLRVQSRWAEERTAEYGRLASECLARVLGDDQARVEFVAAETEKQ